MTFDDPHTAQSAIEWFNNNEFLGCKITVQLAQRQNTWQNKKGGGGGGRGGPGGGRGGFGGGRGGGRDFGGGILGQEPIFDFFKDKFLLNINKQTRKQLKLEFFSGGHDDNERGGGGRPSFGGNDGPRGGFGGPRGGGRGGNSSGMLSLCDNRGPQNLA